MSRCVITSASPTSATISGAPQATFSGFSMAAAATDNAGGAGRRRRPVRPLTGRPADRTAARTREGAGHGGRPSVVESTGFALVTRGELVVPSRTARRPC